MARAIATEPELLLLDEPFGGLNPAETDLLAKSIKRLHQGGRFGRLHVEGPAILIVEHKLPDLMKIVDRIVVLNFCPVDRTGNPRKLSETNRSRSLFRERVCFNLLLKVENLTLYYDTAQVLDRSLDVVRGNVSLIGSMAQENNGASCGRSHQLEKEITRGTRLQDHL
jgi:ABC-type sulfate/molybdate transport systems ATPase subunit